CQARSSVDGHQHRRIKPLPALRYAARPGPLRAIAGPRQRLCAARHPGLWRGRHHRAGTQRRLVLRMPATTSQEMTMDEDWKQAWQPLMDAVGQDFSDGAAIEGA